MTKGLIFITVLAGVAVLAVAGWQASSEGESAAQAQQQARQASPGSEAGSADNGPAAAPDELAGATQTKRLAVENIVQVGGFGCVSCQAVVEGVMQESDGVEKATYDSETDTYLVKVNDDFRLDKVAERVRSISKEYNRRLGLPNRPPWILKEA